MDRTQDLDSLSDSVDKNHVSEDHRQSLEQDRGPAAVVQVLHLQQVSVKVLSRLRQAELKPGEQRGVVQSPLRRVLEHTGSGQDKKTLLIQTKTPQQDQRV